MDWSGRSSKVALRSRSHAARERLSLRGVTTVDQLLDGVPVGIVVLNLDKSVRSANREASRLLGTEQAGIAFERLVAAPARAQVRSYLDSAVAGDANRVSELSPVLRSAAGQVDLMLLARRYRSGSPEEGLLLAIVDVTGARTRALDSTSRDPHTGLANRRTLIDHLTDLVKSGSRGCLLYLDVDGMKEINDSRGHQVGDQVLRTIADRLVQTAPHGALVARIGGDEFVVVAGRLNRPDGQHLAADLRAAVAQPITIRDTQLRISAAVGLIGLAGHSADSALIAADEAMYRDKRGVTPDAVSEADERAAAHRSALALEVDQLRREATRLRDEARTDHLTGCPNRRALFERLTDLDERRRRRTERIAIAFIDIDRFREVNQSGGDEHGDRVLAAAAEVLRRACRPGDVVHRKGGEEFVVTLPNVDAESGGQIAERLRHAVEHARIARGAHPSDGYLSVSIGVAGLSENEPGSVFDTLILAGHRMYAAKNNGRNQVVWRDEPDTGEPNDPPS